VDALVHFANNAGATEPAQCSQNLPEWWTRRVIPNFAEWSVMFGSFACVNGEPLSLSSLLMVEGYDQIFGQGPFERCHSVFL
jgi:hypothetical protein